MHIQVQNFGPLRQIDLRLNRFNVFIGANGGGKSTLSRLLKVLSGEALLQNPSFEFFVAELERNGVPYPFRADTSIAFSNAALRIEVKAGQLHINEGVAELYRFFAYQEKVLKLGHHAPQDSESRLAELAQLLGPLFQQQTGLAATDPALADALLAQSPDLADIHQRVISLRQQLAEGHPLADVALRHLYLRCRDFLELKKEMYIPAERNIFHTLADSVFGLLMQNIPIPPLLKQFGMDFEEARKTLGRAEIGFMNLRYTSRAGESFVETAGAEVKLGQASSGIQSVVPLVLLTDYVRHRAAVPFRLFVEEPEQNLYPSMQKGLAERLVATCYRPDNQVILSTHSPYVLAALDNLVQAHNVALARPDRVEDVAQVVPQNLWLPFGDLSAWSFANGEARYICNRENRSIGANSIDEVSRELDETFEALLDLKYGDDSERADEL